LLSIVLAETALETVPSKIAEHPAIQKDAKRLGRSPDQLLLDASRHSPAMIGIPDEKKRGRPDIAQFCLLLALDHPLNKDGKIRFFIHTRNDQLVLVDPEVRLPRVYHRFCGVFQDLFSKKKVEAGGKTLLELRDGTNLSQTISLAKETAGKEAKVFVFDPAGEKTSFKQLSEKLSSAPGAVVVVGGFPHGSFSDAKALDGLEKISISPHELCAWTVVSEVLSAYAAGQE